MKFEAKIRKMGNERKVIEIPKAVRSEFKDGRTYSCTLKELVSKLDKVFKKVNTKNKR